MRARDNPFTVQRLQTLRYRPAQGPTESMRWETLWLRFDALGRRAAVIGPEGHGKTTLLSEMARQWRSEGRDVRHARLRRGDRWLRAGERRLLFRDLEAHSLLIVDGADQLAPPARWLLKLRSRRAGGLLVATHQSSFLPTLWSCETSPRLLRALLAELGIDEDHRHGPGAEELFARHGGNLRHALAALYDVYAGLPDPIGELGATTEDAAADFTGTRFAE